MPEDAYFVSVLLLASLPMGYFGYGFSTVAVPLLLLRYSNSEVVPVVNMVEVFQNAGLIAMNRSAIRGSAVRQALPLILGTLPGIAIGAYTLKLADPVTLKLVALTALLPLIYMQLFDVRKPIGNMWTVGPVIGLVGGVLYGTTTISGPLLAVVFVNNGLAKGDFRASMATVRLVESWVAMPTYMAMGLSTYATLVAAVTVLPVVLMGMYVGHVLSRYGHADAFRRYAMAFDAVLITYSLHRALIQAGLSEAGAVPIVATGTALALFVRKRLLSLQSM